MKTLPDQALHLMKHLLHALGGALMLQAFACGMASGQAEPAPFALSTPQASDQQAEAPIKNQNEGSGMASRIPEPQIGHLLSIAIAVVLVMRRRSWRPSDS